MSKSKTRAIQTAYGEASIETVVCDSCEMETPKENATRFVIGKPHLSYNNRHNGSDWVYNPKKGTRGWACERCVETSVIGFPTVESALSSVFFWVLVLLPFALGVLVGMWLL